MTLLVYDRGAWWETPPGGREPLALSPEGVLEKLPAQARDGISEFGETSGEEVTIRFLGPVVLRCGPDGLVAWNHRLDAAHTLDAIDIEILSSPDLSRPDGVRTTSVSAIGRIENLVACALVEIHGSVAQDERSDVRVTDSDSPTSVLGHGQEVVEAPVERIPVGSASPPDDGAEGLTRVLATWDIGSFGMPLALGGLLAFARVWNDGVLTRTYDIRRVLDHAELVEELHRDSSPAVILFSSYLWSDEGNLALSKQVKQLNGEHLIVHGGPYVPEDPSELEQHLTANPYIDIVAHGEGEVTLVELLAALNGDIRIDAALSKVSGLTIRQDCGLQSTGARPEHPHLDDFPSPYLSGEFDHIDLSKLPRLLADLWMSGVETDRGCPYSCSFCISGAGGVERLRKFPMERVLGELEWCAKRKIETFFIIDANFGIHPRDVDIAHALVRLRAQYGVPNAVIFSYAKHAVKRVAKIAHILTAAGISSIGALALQTRDSVTLENVKRSNISPAIYDTLAQEFREDGLPLFTDIILGLPGQTVDTFLADLQYCIDTDLTPRIFPAICVRNTEMSSREYRERFGVVTGERDIVLETYSFTKVERDRMMRLRMAYRCFEHFGMLRHVFRYLQWDYGINASEQLDRIERRVHACPADYPLLSWTLGYLDVFLVEPFGWKAFYEEVVRLLQAEFDIEMDSALSTVMDVQMALMPSRLREFPDIRKLDHDYVAWYRINHPDKGNGTSPAVPSIRRLNSFDNGFLEVKDDPQDRCGIGMCRVVEERPSEDRIDIFWAGMHWELGSPLKRLMDVAVRDGDETSGEDTGVREAGNGGAIPITITRRRSGAGARESGAGGPELPGWGPWRSGDRPSGSTGFGADAVERTVGERFFEVADRFAERVAVSSPSGVWTYGDLASRVSRIAGGIRSRVGGRNGDPVALIADHDGPLVAGILGVISAGQVVVILDPAAPTPHTESVLNEASPVLLVSDEAHRDAAVSLASMAGCEHAPLEELEGRFDGPQPLGWRAPAMLAFTSGTTGTPKAAVINHGVLLNIVRGATDISGIGPDDRMAMLFPTSLVVAAYPIFIPLLNGGSLATYDVRSEGLGLLADFLIKERITFAYLAPTVVRFLTDAVGGRSFPDLRIMGIGGELVDTEILAVTCELFGCEYVAVAYGTTETGVVSIAVYHRHALPDGEVSCGYPVEGVEFRILDHSGASLGAGAIGEIAVVSDRLFDGYWRHPELDHLVLGADGSGRPEQRMYRTGDLGRLDENGALTVLGRDDTKVKIRGRFVVLGEVEADLRALDGIADAAVVCRRLGGVPELAAYVVPENRVSAAPTRWRAALLERREAYRVPSRWVVLDELPLLPNGKMDRRSLPEPEGRSTMNEAIIETDVARFRDDVVRHIRDTWEQLFSGRIVDLDDDFFELGGDSLLAAQMLVMLEHRTGIPIPMGDLVHARTVRQLAEVLRHRGAQQRSGAVSTVACVQAGDESTHPLLWFVHDLHGSAYRVRRVAAELGSDWPVWSFESPLLAGERNPHLSLDTFAARYLTDLQEVQPQGPYWLAGYSFGGVCAFEMARQLRAAGEEVAFLGVVDIGPGLGDAVRRGRRSPLRPWFGVAKPPPEGAGVRASLDHYRRMFAEGPLRVARHLMVRSGAYRMVDPLRFEIDLRRNGRVRPEWRLWYSWEEHWKLVVKGWDRSSTFPGRLDLFWAHDSPSEDASMGWAPRVGELRVHRFEGDHNGVLEPRGASQLATVLRDVLETEEAHAST